MPKVAVIIHSLYGHVKSVAEAEIEGLKKEGIEVKLLQVRETLPEEVLQKMHAQKFDLPIATPNDLLWADGILVGLSTRYGGTSAQMKAFWDSTGQLWAQGKLKGKFGGVFQSSAGASGGQESAALTFLSNFVHHGIIFVPSGFHPNLSSVTEVFGGSYWGAGTVAGADGSRQISKLEHEMAVAQGEDFGKLLNRLK